jgi:hypothetical protein
MKNVSAVEILKSLGNLVNKVSSLHFIIFASFLKHVRFTLTYLCLHFVEEVSIRSIFCDHVDVLFVPEVSIKL